MHNHPFKTTDELDADAKAAATEKNTLTACANNAGQFPAEESVEAKVVAAAVAAAVLPVAIATETASANAETTLIAVAILPD